MSLVVDASFVVAMLVDDGDAGEWARDRIDGERLMAPQHLPVEVANVLRRMELRDVLTSTAADAAHSALLTLRISFVRYSRYADRIWRLRNNVTPYDAAYVALAEALDLPLATIDDRLVRATGPRCEFLTLPLDE